MQKIILASQSPRRKELLKLANINFEVIVADTDEGYPPALTFNEIAIHIATQKALAVAQKNTLPAIILAADTIVVCNNQVIGKPKDKADAINILTNLAGNTHHVITGVCILHNDKVTAFADVTLVNFNPLTLQQITFYVDNYKPYDKAGAYAIQEWIGAVGINKIDGDFYNVMGLPINKVVQILATMQA